MGGRWSPNFYRCKFMPAKTSLKIKTAPDLSEELEAYRAGYQNIAGLDEAGRGAWAGPLVAAAVVLPRNLELPLEQALQALTTRFAGVNDSKQLTPPQREKLFALIKTHAYTGVGIISSLAVDLMGVGVANKLAWKRAIQNLPAAARPDFLLLDAFKLPEVAIAQKAIIKGDTKSLSIAAASIIAKVTRDCLMQQLAQELPGYGFHDHKGYGTATHAAALQRLGPSDSHRYSYRPIWQVYCQTLPPELAAVALQETTTERKV